MKTGVPPFAGSPIDEFVYLGAGHAAYYKLTRHRGALLPRTLGHPLPQRVNPR
jgi:hypothetical protein